MVPITLVFAFFLNSPDTIAAAKPCRQPRYITLQETIELSLQQGGTGQAPAPADEDTRVNQGIRKPFSTGGVAWSAPSTTAPQQVQQWEYRFVDRHGCFWPKETDFNALGAEGWELVGTMQGQGTTDTWIFKRPKRGQ
jgi:hypothetical protein